MLPIRTLVPRTLVVVLVTLLAVAGCGRRGPLEAPGATTPSAASAAPNAVSPLDPGSHRAVPLGETKPQGEPDRPFFLDFLL
jgi:predicted small lipoprotein YifL